MQRPILAALIAFLAGCGGASDPVQTPPPDTLVLTATNNCGQMHVTLHSPTCDPWCREGSGSDWSKTILHPTAGDYEVSARSECFPGDYVSPTEVSVTAVYRGAVIATKSESAMFDFVCECGPTARVNFTLP